MKGKITKQYTAHCGTCADTHTESCDTKPTFIQQVKSVGWKASTKFGWLCPMCKICGGVFICTQCRQQGQPPHPCPYKEDVKGDDDLCTCCKVCEDRCGDDV